MSSLDSPTFARVTTCGDDPKMIGCWKLGRTIGKGSSARVKLARHSKTGQMAAVKIIRKSFLFSCKESLDNAEEEAARLEQALQREIVIMKLVDHPNIMKLHDVWDTANHLYLILEHVQGGELFNYLCEKGRLSPSEALGYFQQIIAAVDYCHRFNIVHRDLKLENILLDSQSNVKLADFGMATWRPDRMFQTSCGSPHYAAPEIVNGEVYDGAASDIWSCAIILHGMLAGRLPFDDDDCLKLLEKVRVGKFEMADDIDPLAQDLIAKMLVKDVKKRLTMSGVQNHPFFTSRSFAFANVPARNLDDITCPLLSRDDIDTELLRHLRTLWPNSSDDDLVDNLLSDEKNWHKGIYYLLGEYRRKHWEGYEEAETFARSERLRRQRKRGTSCTPQNQLSPDLYPYVTPSPSIPPRDGPPTPRRARGGKVSAASSEGSVTYRRGQVSPRIDLHLPSSSGSSSNVIRPSPLIVPQHHDIHIQTFFKQVADHINVLYSRTERSQSPTTITSANLALMHNIVGDRTMQMELPIASFLPSSPQQNTVSLSPIATTIQPLSVTRSQHPAGPTDKENNDEATTSCHTKLVAKSSEENQVGANHKRVKILDLRDDKERTKLRKRKVVLTSPAISASEYSPVPSSPGTKWLANVFKFRRSAFTLQSTHGLQTTQNECRRLLMAMDVRVVLVDSEHLSVLKCRVDEMKDPSGVKGMLKPVKFRVEVDAEVGAALTLIMVQEKGSTESFKEIYRRLRRDWVFDVVGSRTPDQVAWKPLEERVVPTIVI
ncbi:Pkinase-domain-containing protein [Guyanagaster necrorhizus]|uniref:non-specific serine/threonine protein kinase n=1 Tax=Guyanagaster necrorhizus TaxID=856835 RepID=A0A9P7VQU7_9AGAR|nr:Pkinase-domain-containing protein [Guyanagaster necrorhizus MCA 3950]KAG7444326.1 Pkinase-domain-containing protein [Guyanagaster necrorhizus MCA 3950]